MKLKANEYIYSIKNLTYGEVREIEYAYGQFIHNAVSGDFAETNGRLDELRARIEKKPITETSSDEEFITIPKPKFQLGDTLIYNGYIIKADEVFYDLGTGRWLYNCIEEERAIDFYESELELVERKENDKRNSIGL